jgi:hypothetical protein
MLEIVASAEIEAPAETVWNVLTDLSSYPDWNPFIRKASGTLRVGKDVRVRVQTAMARVSVPFRATILTCEPSRELRWRGHVLAPWIGDGEHTFTIEPANAGRVRFVQREVFRGLLPRFARRLLERETWRGFDAMNRALRQRAEAARSAPQRASCATP